MHFLTVKFIFWVLTVSESWCPLPGAAALPHRNAVCKLQAPVGRCDWASSVSVSLVANPPVKINKSSINAITMWLCLVPSCRSHARGMNNKDFWKIYYEHLELVAGLAGKGFPPLLVKVPVPEISFSQLDRRQFPFCLFPKKIILKYIFP